MCHRGCAYTVFQSPGVCSAVYNTVHYKEPVKSFDQVKSRAWSRRRASFSRDIGMFDRKLYKAIFTHLTHALPW